MRKSARKFFTKGLTCCLCLSPSVKRTPERMIVRLGQPPNIYNLQVNPTRRTFSHNSSKVGSHILWLLINVVVCKDVTQASGIHRAETVYLPRCLLDFLLRRKRTHVHDAV